MFHHKPAYLHYRFVHKYFLNVVASCLKHHQLSQHYEFARWFYWNNCIWMLCARADINLPPISTKSFITTYTRLILDFYPIYYVIHIIGFQFLMMVSKKNLKKYFYSIKIIFYELIFIFIDFSNNSSNFSSTFKNSFRPQQVFLIYLHSFIDRMSSKAPFAVFGLTRPPRRVDCTARSSVYNLKMEESR